MTRPLAIDLYCGLGGWTDGLLAEGWDVVGFDIERHDYDGERYAGKLVIQDVRTLHGAQFRAASLIVASPPCEAYSYRAMPWARARALPPPDNELFDACFRIQAEASSAAGRHIPLIVENVIGAQRWVGRARWNHGSFFLWGDVPALMPMRFGREARKGADDQFCNGEQKHKWFDGGLTKFDSRGAKRKAASARIAKIPYPLASYIARVFFPTGDRQVAA